MPSDYDEVLVLNQGLELRTSKTGKTRATIKVTAEPLVHRFDAKQLGRGPAAAIAKHLQDRVRQISIAASPATLRARKVAERALAAGKPWATKRYAGGRIGAMSPNQSLALFNDSGRLAKSLTANASGDDAWRVNVAANRLDAATADRGGAAAVEQMFARLVELVPEFGDAEQLLGAFTVRRAIEDSTNQLIAKAAATSGELTLELAQLALEVFRAADEAVDSLAVG